MLLSLRDNPNNGSEGDYVTFYFRRKRTFHLKTNNDSCSYFPKRMEIAFVGNRNVNMNLRK